MKKECRTCAQWRQFADNQDIGMCYKTNHECGAFYLCKKWEKAGKKARERETRAAEYNACKVCKFRPSDENTCPLGRWWGDDMLDCAYWKPKEPERLCAACGLWEEYFNDSRSGGCEYLGITTKRGFGCVCWERHDAKQEGPFGVRVFSDVAFIGIDKIGTGIWDTRDIESRPDDFAKWLNEMVKK